MRRLNITSTGEPCGVDRLERLALHGLDGVDWYVNGNRELRIVAERENWSVDRFASVFAITSPKVSVLRNIRTTYRYMKHREVFPNTIGLVRLLLEHYESTGELGIGTAPKINAFKRAILGDENAIVLDSWMSVALRVAQNRFDGAKLRQACELRIVACAKRLALSPADCQATIWTGVNRLYGRQPGQPSFIAEYENWLSHGRRYNAVGVVEQKEVHCG